jgi:hypothetical protein
MDLMPTTCFTKSIKLFRIVQGSGLKLEALKCLTRLTPHTNVYAVHLLYNEAPTVPSHLAYFVVRSRVVFTLRPRLNAALVKTVMRRNIYIAGWMAVVQC